MHDCSFLWQSVYDAALVHWRGHVPRQSLCVIHSSMLVNNTEQVLSCYQLIEVTSPVSDCGTDTRLLRINIKLRKGFSCHQ